MTIYNINFILLFDNQRCYLTINVEKCLTINDNRCSKGERGVHPPIEERHGGEEGAGGEMPDTGKNTDTDIVGQIQVQILPKKLWLYKR